MVPALRLDFDEVDRRVRKLAGLLSRAEGADLLFRVDEESHRLHLDLRHRQGHASSPLLREPGQAWNLPSGEGYVVPYEGEREGEPSRSAGTLPVELDGEVVLFRIEKNRAVEVISSGDASLREAAHLNREPARGNVAELGFGVLAGFGIQPIGSILLDEKLGLHVAFGRSDHFGGRTGPSDFRDPREVVHQDHVYLASLQPRVRAESVDLVVEGRPEPLMCDGRYVIEFD
jgi:leucyl aminopeptidase (aminopeptidase T)